MLAERTSEVGRLAAVPVSDPTARFGAVLEVPERAVRLDEAALLIAAHADHELDVNAELARLDDIAEQCPAPTLDGVIALLFRDLGFRGDTDDYYDPANSLLHEVVARRRGIPITLSLLVMEVGRRVGAPTSGVSMPGHFLVRDRVDTEVFVDPFHRGAILDRHACRRLFDSLHRGRLTFDDSFLEPVGAHAILTRILMNLKAIHLARRDQGALVWVQRLLALVPGVSPEEAAADIALRARLN
jgi:regulator of sirC expression with transglutaminase-like and TPR domain